MDKSIEAAAEAYYYAVVGELGAHASWEEFTEDEKTYHTEKMRAAIAAYRDAEIERLREEKEHWRAQYCLELVASKNAEAKLEAAVEANKGSLKAAAYWKALYDNQTAAIEAAERDAERYRWLTINEITTLPFVGVYRQDDEQPRQPILKTIGNGFLVKPEIDAAIDAARGGERG